MNNALLDTDIYSEVLRGVNATVAAHAYRQAHCMSHPYQKLTRDELCRTHREARPHSR
jgi:hypothetical protein